MTMKNSVAHPDKKEIQNPLKENSDNQMQHKPRYIPLFRNVKIRTAIGFFLLILSVTSMWMIFGKGRIEFIALISVFAWIISVFFTDKYVHKYPQRYFTYLIASHMKATIIMAILLWIMGWIIGQKAPPHDVLWSSFFLFVIADALASVPRRRVIPDRQSQVVVPATHVNDITENISTDADYLKSGSSLIDKQTILSKIRCDLDKSFFEFIENNLPDLKCGSGNVFIIDDVTQGNVSKPASVGLLIGRTRINDVLRLNNFMQFCTERICIGGYFVISYLPLENVINNFNQHYEGLNYLLVFILHFIWYRFIPKIPYIDKLYFSPKLRWLDALHLFLVKKRNRALSKAELWGRLAYYGMRVIMESKGDGVRYLIAQRTEMPHDNKLPSYHSMIVLEKVGLDGKIMHIHKIRTMFPFSEFLQKRIFEDHGLTSNGKFKDDFRLTEWGGFFRRYWLDELPQIFDWLRGDIKLVGLRATSRQFLSLYPRKFYDLYIQIKPGLIPPIFDENTNGFDQIVQVELTYLQRYLEHPIRTDIRYFFSTFINIVFRGIRSK